MPSVEWTRSFCSRCELRLDDALLPGQLLPWLLLAVSTVLLGQTCQTWQGSTIMLMHLKDTVVCTRQTAQYWQRIAQQSQTSPCFSFPLDRGDVASCLLPFTHSIRCRRAEDKQPETKKTNIRWLTPPPSFAGTLEFSLITACLFWHQE